MKKILLIGFLFVGTIQAQDTLQNKVRKYGSRQLTAQCFRTIAIPVFYYAAKQEEKQTRDALMGIGVFFEALAFAIELNSNIGLRDK